MANCLSLTGYAKGCDASLGGIKKVALFEKAGLSGATIASGEMTGLVMLAGYSAYTYDFLKDNSNYTQPIVGDGILTSVHWEPSITLVFRKTSKSLRNEIYELSKGELCAIIKDYNDNYWFFGYSRGLNLIASAGSSSGNKLEELNGETIILKGTEPEPAYSVNISNFPTQIKNLFI